MGGRMKWYKHSNNKQYPWPEKIKPGYELLITPEFKQIYRKIKKTPVDNSVD